MLGIRLSPEAEEALARHARATGRGKSVIAREWILDRLDQESIDAAMRRAARDLAKSDKAQGAEALAGSTEWLEALDAEDGGYDWGSEGPPA